MSDTHSAPLVREFVYWTVRSRNNCFNISQNQITKEIISEFATLRKQLVRTNGQAKSSRPPGRGGRRENWKSWRLFFLFFCYCVGVSLNSPSRLSLFAYVLIFAASHKQPRCRAAFRPIFTGYGKLTLSNAILRRRGYPPTPPPMDMVQVSFDDPHQPSSLFVMVRKWSQSSYKNQFNFLKKISN